MDNLQNKGWIHRKCHLPTEADGDKTGKVFVWHAFQGVMLVCWDEFTSNRYHVYWMPVSYLDEIPWINAMERLPTQEDADALNCVLAMEDQNAIRVTGFHQFSWNRRLSHWRRLPAPPSDAKELRKME